MSQAIIAMPWLLDLPRFKITGEKKKPACSLVGSGNLKKKKKKSHSTLKIKNKSSHIGISHTTAPKEVNSTVVLHQQIGKKMKEE